MSPHALRMSICWEAAGRAGCAVRGLSVRRIHWRGDERASILAIKAVCRPPMAALRTSDTGDRRCGTRAFRFQPAFRIRLVSFAVVLVRGGDWRGRTILYAFFFYYIVSLRVFVINGSSSGQGLPVAVHVRSLPVPRSPDSHPRPTGSWTYSGHTWLVARVYGTSVLQMV